MCEFALQLFNYITHSATVIKINQYGQHRLLPMEDNETMKSAIATSSNWKKLIIIGLEATPRKRRRSLNTLQKCWH